MQNYLTKLLLVAAVAYPAVSMGGVISTDYAFNVSGNYQYKYFEQTVNESSDKSATTAVSQFDASLGTLTDAKVSFTSSFRSFVRAQSSDTRYERRRNCGWSRCTRYYDDDVGVSATLTQSFDVSLENYAGVGVNLDKTYELDCNKVLNDSRANSCIDREGWETTSYVTELALAGADLTGFIGTGALDLTFLNTNSTSATCKSNNEVYCRTWNHSDQWRGTITVEYTYEEVVASVSEPSGLALFAFSFPALWLVRRRNSLKA